MGVEAIGGIEKIMAAYDAKAKTYGSVAAGQQQTAGAQAENDPVSVNLQRVSNTMGKLESVNEEKNLFAKNVRAADRALESASGVVSRMKGQLETILKNFPPFPADSADRKAILMSYSSLRKEILSMTFPPPPVPVYEKNVTLWDKFGYNDAQKLSDSVPEVTPASTDAQVKAASDGLDSLQAAVSAGRGELLKAVTG